MEETTTKVCRKCGQEKPDSEFYKGANKDGLSSYCKECTSEYNKTKYAAKKSEKQEKIPPRKRKTEFSDVGSNILILEIRTRLRELESRGFIFKGKLNYMQEIEL